MFVLPFYNKRMYYLFAVLTDIGVFYALTLRCWTGNCRNS